MDTGYFLIKTRSQTQPAIEGGARTPHPLIACWPSLAMLAAPIERQVRQLAVAPLEELLPIAEAVSVKLGAEPIHQCYPGYSFPDTLEFVETVGSSGPDP